MDQMERIEAMMFFNNLNWLGGTAMVCFTGIAITGLILWHKRRKK